MRAAFIILATAACAAAAPGGHKHSSSHLSSRQSSIQCTPVDDDGTALTGTAEAGNFIVCTYAGAGPCTYFPPDGSFASGGSSCPAGIAQDPSVTTAATAQASPTSPRAPTVLPDAPAASSASESVTPSAHPALPGVPAPSSASAAESANSGFITGVPAPSASPSASGFLTGVPAPSLSASPSQSSAPNGGISLHHGLGGVLIAVGLAFFAL
ncbi:hypothetical protein C8R43DRAFT_1112110 [Mycena crocata]|nr:hypothetical protein C8R43DRAFT_1112110 [Mycena crocata]